MSIQIHRLVRWSLLALAILVNAEAAATLPGQTIGTAERVVGDVYGDSLLRKMRDGETLIANQHVRTGVESAAELKFLDESHLIIGSRSEVLLDQLVFNPDRNLTEGIISVLSGILRFASSGKALDVTVNTRSASIGIRGTVFDVFESPRSTEVAVHEGRVQVDSPYGSVVVSEGEVLTISGAGDLPVSHETSEGMRSAVSAMLALVGSDTEPDTNGAGTQHQSRDSTALSHRPGELEDTTIGLPDIEHNRDLENLLYMDLRYGRVVIELRPDLAPRHVARIRELARSNFYDGSAFYSVVPELVAQSGDPTGTGHGGSGITLTAEFSEENFRRGSVGMRRDMRGPDTADSQFFICFQDCSQYDGMYTFWGQVIDGMQFVDQLRPGHPPRIPDKIIRMRVASDMAK